MTYFYVTGVIAAYRAFRNTQSYRKPDLRLPNPMAGQLTPDQVFFMSYSQTMCQTTPKQAELYKQLVLDQAAPQNTRVMGAVQHLQQFTTAFNCPVWSVEAQRNLAKNRCNIWNNEVNAVTGTPPTTTTLPNLNVPMRLDQNSSRYVEVADRIANLVDTTQDVCNNFYQYACGPFGKHYENPFLEAAEYKSFEQLAAALKTNSPTSDNYNRVSNAKSFYNSCIDNIKDIQSQSRNNIFASDYIDTFNGETGVPFPLMESPDNEYKFSSLDSSYMGYALDASGHILLDQPQMVLPRHFYHGDRWSIIQSLYQADIEQILTAYITNTTTNNANQTAVREVAASIVDLEATLAQYQFTGDEDDYLNYLGAYQPKIIGQLKVGHLSCFAHIRLCVIGYQDNCR
ncbi:peptidase family m13 domain-containing protein [Ditylenchus destructor]|uniref:Peptidase family m13 domain-containing protein n=1 Tax=Ditylenchus destructor TaxID=166010 RepID=A0AAD4N8Y3_9BILA|nr:peptidase family m13 domain-containing protein [Ditylenchus destructor]